MKHLIAVALVMIPFAANAGDPKAGAPMPPPPPAKDLKAQVPPPAPAKPPQELADMAKAMGGAWKCTGTVEIGTEMLAMTGTVTHTTNLDGWWMTSSITGSIGKLTMHSALMTTYDTAAKKFYRMGANGHGGHSAVWGTQSGTKMSWEGDGRWSGNDVKIRDAEEMTSAKEAHITGEYSKDGGKTWSKDHDITCKK